MEQARGERQSNTSLTLSYTQHKQSLHVIHVREEGKPLLEINYSAPFTGGIWGFFSLVPFSGHTPLPRGCSTLWMHSQKNLPTLHNNRANAHCVYLSSYDKDKVINF